MKKKANSIFWEMMHIAYFVLSKFWSKFKVGGSVIIRSVVAIVGFTLALPSLLPLLILQRILSKSGKFLTPFIDGLRFVLYWGPRKMMLKAWNFTCAIVEYMAIIAIMLIIYLIKFSLDLSRGNVNSSHIRSMVERANILVRFLPVLILSVSMTLLLSLSQLSAALGSKFRKTDDIVKGYIEFLVTKEELENMSADLREWAKRHVSAKDEPLEELSVESERIINESNESLNEAKENLSRGEFVISILIAISSLSLTFFPNFKNISLTGMTIFGNRINLNLQFTLQIILTLLTLWLLVSVVLRVRIMDYFVIDDISESKSKEEIILDVDWNRTVATSIWIIPVGILFNESTSIADEIDYEVVKEKGELSNREMFFKELYKLIDDNRSG